MNATETKIIETLKENGADMNLNGFSGMTANQVSRETGLSKREVLNVMRKMAEVCKIYCLNPVASRNRSYVAK